jgi:hypothetical protein
MWSLLLKEPRLPHIRHIEFTSDVNPACEDLNWQLGKLPDTLTSAKITVYERESADPHILRSLDYLPNLQRLELHGRASWHLTELPNLVRCLRSVSIEWPQQRELLGMDNAIEELALTYCPIPGVNVGQMPVWSSLSGLRDLKKLTLIDFSTSMVTGLGSVPQIEELLMIRPRRGLDDAPKRVVAGLRGIKIAFRVLERGLLAGEEEVAFWRSLDFV